MLNDKKVAVVIPAYNEENQIGSVLESIPAFVDIVLVINDGSTDRTSLIVNQKNKDRGFELIEIINPKNRGVGFSIATGYAWCKENKIDCTAVMAGDGQMSPDDLLPVCMPVINNEVDYVKGNRFFHDSAWEVIPKVRLLGNSVLSLLTKLASGYWSVSDTQCGYTAISLKALNSIQISKIYSSYGVPNDILAKLNMAHCSITEIEVQPIYNIGEQSKMKIKKVIPRISWLLLRLFFKRLWLKYFFRDINILFFLYHFSFFLFLVDLPYIYKIASAFANGKVLSYEPLFAFVFLTILVFNFFLFAVWLDIKDNERLYKP